MHTLEHGLTGTRERVVTAAETAEAFGSGLVPVFATPAMVALMEGAAVEALEGRLQPGDTTVGTRIDVRHLAATPIGDRVRADAVLDRVEDRRLTFTVTAWDSAGKIGDGTHERLIVSRERFLARAAREPR